MKYTTVSKPKLLHQLNKFHSDRVSAKAQCHVAGSKMTRSAIAQSLPGNSSFLDPRRLTRAETREPETS